MTGRQRNQNERSMAQMKSYTDIAMGLLYIFISVYMLKMPALSERFGKNFLYIFAALFIAYGIYRAGKGLRPILQAKKKQ